MVTTAEGVETQDQLDELRREGCTEVQGFLFSPARPIAEASGLIERGLNRDLARHRSEALLLTTCRRDLVRGVGR